MKNKRFFTTWLITFCFITYEAFTLCGYHWSKPMYEVFQLTYILFVILLTGRISKVWMWSFLIFALISDGVRMKFFDNATALTQPGSLPVRVDAIVSIIFLFVFWHILEKLEKAQARVKKGSEYSFQVKPDLTIEFSGHTHFEKSPEKSDGDNNFVQPSIIDMKQTRDGTWVPREK